MPFKLGAEIVRNPSKQFKYMTNSSLVEKTYIYKGDRFWRFNETSKTLDEGYPLLMDRWRGVPNDLDGATTWNDGEIYKLFF